MHLNTNMVVWHFLRIVHRCELVAARVLYYTTSNLLRLVKLLYIKKCAFEKSQDLDLVYELRDFVHRLCCIFDTCNSILLNSLHTPFACVVRYKRIYLLKFICTFHWIILYCTATSNLSEMWRYCIMKFWTHNFPSECLSNGRTIYSHNFYIHV